MGVEFFCFCQQRSICCIKLLRSVCRIAWKLHFLWFSGFVLWED